MEGTTLLRRRLFAGVAAAAVVVAGLGVSLSGVPQSARAEEGDSAAQDELVSEAGAKITQLDDGTLVQRTPDDLGMAVYTNPTNEPSYNVRYLNADERGCGSCHDDLGTLLQTMDYDHIDIKDDYGSQLTVDSCMYCHESADYITTKYNFGELIHGIHQEQNLNCMTCHAVTDSYEGSRHNGYEQVTGQFLLWDDAKYDILRGISSLDTVEGDFTFDQDFRSDRLFYTNWMGWSSDYQRYANEDADLPRDEQMLDDWEFTVVGLDGTRTTFRMGDLIEEIPSVTDVRTISCNVSCTNGGLVSNVEVTGIPLNSVLEMAGVDIDSIGSMLILDSAQAEAQWSGWPFAYDSSDEHPDLLVYKVNGELLSWANGFPVVNWAGGTSGAFVDVKEVSEIQCLTEEPAPVLGLDDYAPNISVFHLKDGQVVNLGDTLSIEGVADCYSETITGIQFSLDNGQTWTEHETPDTHAGNWTHFNLDWTPQATGAYVLSVRAVDESGSLTDVPARYLINVVGPDDVAFTGDADAAQAVLDAAAEAAADATAATDSDDTAADGDDTASDSADTAADSAENE